MRRFSALVGLFFCTLPEIDFANNFEVPIKWCTLDLVLQRVGLLRKLVPEFYFRSAPPKPPGFVTVHDFFESCESPGGADQDAPSGKQKQASEAMAKFKRYLSSIEERSRLSLHQSALDANGGLGASFPEKVGGFAGKLCFGHLP